MTNKKATEVVCEAGQVETALQTAKSTETGALLQLAVNKDLDVDKLSKLVELHQVVMREQARKEFTSALARAKAKIPIIRKNEQQRVVTKTGSGYVLEFASIDHLTEVCDPHLEAEGFSYWWDTDQINNGDMKVTCNLEHAAGHSRQSHIVITPGGSPTMSQMQKQRSGWHYARRITFESVLGLAVSKGEDHDGAEGVERISEDQVANIEALLTEAAADRAKFLKWLQIDTVEAMLTGQYKMAVSQLERKRRAQ